ncbi:unnamed protein product [Gordionus sp. m RMFG-2023]|uniref:uncharacterized protein LOC135931562 isoform X2 n=1 Tax=Gordionus sp. m RMFG-2023 TaxID=3053472 RepID=UPI0030E2409F
MESLIAKSSLTTSKLQIIVKNVATPLKEKMTDREGSQSMDNRKYALNSAMYDNLERTRVLENIEAEFCRSNSNVKLVHLFFNHTLSGYIEYLCSPLHCKHGKKIRTLDKSIRVTPSDLNDRDHKKWVVGAYPKNESNKKVKVLKDLNKSIEAFPESLAELVKAIHDSFVNSLAEKIEHYKTVTNRFRREFLTTFADILSTRGHQNSDINAQEKRGEMIAKFKGYTMARTKLCTLLEHSGASNISLSLKELMFIDYLDLIQSTSLAYDSEEDKLFLDKRQMLISYDITEKFELAIYDRLLDIDGAQTHYARVPILELLTLMFVSYALTLKNCFNPLFFHHIASKTIDFLQRASRASHHLDALYAPGYLQSWIIIICLNTFDIISHPHSKPAPRLHPDSPQNAEPTSTQSKNKGSPIKIKIAKKTDKTRANNESSSCSRMTMRDVNADFESVAIDNNPMIAKRESHSLKNKAHLLGYAKQALEELGEICGTLPAQLFGDAENTHQLSASALNLISEIAEMCMVCLKQIGRMRSAKLVGKDMAQFLLRSKDFERAEIFYLHLLKQTEREGWKYMCINIMKDLVLCRLASCNEATPNIGIQKVKVDKCVYILLTLACCSEKYFDGNPILTMNERKFYYANAISIIYNKNSNNNEQIFGDCFKNESKADEKTAVHNYGIQQISCLMDHIAILQWIQLPWIDRVLSSEKSTKHIGISFRFGLISHLPTLESGSKGDRKISETPGKPNNENVENYQEGAKSDIEFNDNYNDYRPWFKVRLYYKRVRDVMSPTEEPASNKANDMRNDSAEKIYFPGESVSGSLWDIHKRNNMAYTKLNLTDNANNFHGLKCDNKDDLLSASPSYYRSNNDTPELSANIYSYPLSASKDLDSNDYLETEMELFNGINQYEIKFSVENNFTYIFTDLVLVLASTYHYTQKLSQYCHQLGKIVYPCSCSVNLKRPHLYFYSLKDIDQRLLSLIGPANVSIHEETYFNDKRTTLSYESVFRGSKPLAGIEEDWVLLVMAKDFCIPSNTSINLVKSEGLMIKFPSDNGSQGKDALITLNLDLAIEPRHILVMRCKMKAYFYDKFSDQDNEGLSYYDHKIEISGPWCDEEPIIQNLRFFPPFTLKQTATSSGLNKKYIQLLVKCKTENSTFILSAPELELPLNNVNVKSLNVPKIPLVITKNQSASFVWLLDILPSISAISIPSSSYIKAFIRFNYNLTNNEPILSSITPDSRLVYPFTLPNLTTIFTIKTVVSPWRDNDDPCRHSMISRGRGDGNQHFDKEFVTKRNDDHLNISGDIECLNIGFPCLFRVNLTNIVFPERINENNQTSKMTFKCKVVCDPCVWKLYPPDIPNSCAHNYSEIFTISPESGSEITLDKIIYPVSKGYYPAPSIKLFKFDNKIESLDPIHTYNYSSGIQYQVLPIIPFK